MNRYQKYYSKIYQFTLKLNPNHDDHKIVIDYLKSLKSEKNKFIIKLIYDYIQKQNKDK